MQVDEMKSHDSRLSSNGDNITPAKRIRHVHTKKSFIEKALRSIAPLYSASRSERKALAWILPYMRESRWLQSIQLRQAIDSAGNPTPWISYAAIHFLSQRIRPEFTVFEYGSGNSTLWWSSHTARVVSCEHNQKWFQKMSAKLPANVEYIHETIEGGQYPSVITKFDSFDVIMIDGRERVSCTSFAIEKLKADGVIVFDNSDRERYQPAFDLLASRGFRRLDFVSMGPISQKPISTSIFYRDDNCLGI